MTLANAAGSCKISGVNCTATEESLAINVGICYEAGLHTMLWHSSLWTFRGCGWVANKTNKTTWGANIGHMMGQAALETG